MDAKDKIIAEQVARIAELEKLVAELLLRIAKLEKNSKTSSKPPSSDIVKPPKPPLPNGQKRKPGGQPGHTRNVRSLLEPSAVNLIVDLPLSPDEQICRCGGILQRDSEIQPRIMQQAELVGRGIVVTQYQMPAYVCLQCGKIRYPKLPESTKKAGFFGPRLQMVVLYMKGRGHLSIKAIQAFSCDLYQLPVSTGYLAKILKRSSQSIEAPYKELVKATPEQAVVHADETGLRNKGVRRWVWVFAGEAFTVFKISPSRGSQVLEEMLGTNFTGVLCSDFWSAYKKYGKKGVLLQFCWAHLVRDIKFLATLDDTEAKTYANALLEQVRLIFAVWHQRKQLGPEETQTRLRPLRLSFIRVATEAIPDNKSCQNMGNRFIQFGDEYFQFVENTNVPPTNNFAEQQIRPVTIDRYITHGCRSDWGERLSERLWSVLATCKQQGIAILDFLTNCAMATLGGIGTPTLLGTR